MEIRTIHIKTSHDLRPLIKLMDLTEETPESLLLLLGIGAARTIEMAVDENNDNVMLRAKDILLAVEQIKKELEHGES